MVFSINSISISITIQDSWFLISNTRFLCYSQLLFCSVCSIFDHIPDLEYSRVSLTGYYDHSKELYMWPRTLNTADVSAQRNTEPGACIVTPFYCYELGQWVLVNRGWVPRRKMDPATRPKGQVLIVHSSSSSSSDIELQGNYIVHCTLFLVDQWDFTIRASACMMGRSDVKCAPFLVSYKCSMMRSF